MVDPITMMLAGAAFKYTKDYLNRREARKQRAQYVIARSPSPPELTSNEHWREVSEDDDSSSDNMSNDDDDEGWCSRCNASHYDEIEQDWLRDPKTAFRIIELEPGEGEEPLVLKQDENSIYSAGEYEALSYRWDDLEEGDDASKLPHVHLNGGIFRVSYSVIFALFRLRHPSRTRRLWIDQLCIVQNDDVTKATSEAEKEKRRRAAAEKSEQLRIMGTIYKNAAQTIIWLGPDSMPSEVSACKIIESFEPLRIEMEKCIEQEVQPLIRRGGPNWKKASEIEVQKFNWLCHMISLKTEELLEKGVDEDRWLSTLAEDGIRNIIRFYQRDWFGRTWPVQEVVLSKDKVVLCGDDITLSWKQVGWFAAYFAEKFKHRDYADYETAGIESAKYMYFYSSTYTNGFPFAQMLRATRRFETGDPKDKVYALLGMVNFNLKADNKSYNPRLRVVEQVPREIPVDSSKTYPWIDLYHDVAKYFIQRDQNLEILSSREHVDNWDELPRPSWVPRWDVREQSQQVWIPGAMDKDNFAANTNLDSSISFSTVTVAAATFRTCTVRGVEVDVLSQCWFLPLLSDGTAWTSLANDIGGIVDSFRDSRSFDGRNGIVAELAMALTAGRRHHQGSVVSTATYTGLTIEQHEHIADFISFILDLADHTASADFYQYSKDSFEALVAHITPRCKKPRHKDGLKSDYAVRCQEALRNRSIFRTRSGKLAVGPVAAQIGDQVVVFKGGRVPFIVRKVADGSDEAQAGSHQLVGEFYCYGLMNRETDPQMSKGPDFFTLV